MSSACDESLKSHFAVFWLGLVFQPLPVEGAKVRVDVRLGAALGVSRHASLTVSPFASNSETRWKLGRASWPFVDGAGLRVSRALALDRLPAI